jgi:hypothetical protein
VEPLYLNMYIFIFRHFERLSKDVANIVEKSALPAPPAPRIQLRQATPTQTQEQIAKYLSKNTWDTGGGEWKTGLESAIKAMGVHGVNVAQLWGDTRRDYIQLLLGNTLSLDGMAALNNDKNLAFRDSYFNDEWNKRGHANKISDMTINILKQLADFESGKDTIDFEAALRKKDTLLKEINRFAANRDEEKLKSLKDLLEGSEERLEVLFTWVGNNYLTDTAKKEVIKKVNELAAWNKKTGQFLLALQTASDERSEVYISGEYLMMA